MKKNQPVDQVNKMTSAEIREKLCSPPVLAEKDQYRIKFAMTPEEIEAAFRLRYQVFKVEQGKNIQDSGKPGIDQDEFDQYCLHLVVEEKETGKVVGTYRVHPGPTALTHELGFYSSHEFNIEGLDAIANQTFEMGRSCVSADSRSGSVVALLWAGVSEIVGRSRLRYLIGCVSLEEMDPAAGWALYDYFVEQSRISDMVKGTPLPSVKMPRPSDAVMEEYKKAHPVARTLIPPLFKGYLRMGAKICSEPVFDAGFGTIDFLILLDTGRLPERYQKHFNVVSAE